MSEIADLFSVKNEAFAGNKKLFSKPKQLTLPGGYLSNVR